MAESSPAVRGPARAEGPPCPGQVGTVLRGFRSPEPRQGSAGSTGPCIDCYQLSVLCCCHWWVSVWRGDVLNLKAQLRAEDATNLLQCPEHMGKCRNWLETNFGLQFLVNSLRLESTCCVMWVKL